MWSGGWPFAAQTPLPCGHGTGTSRGQGGVQGGSWGQCPQGPRALAALGWGRRGGAGRVPWGPARGGGSDGGVAAPTPGFPNGLPGASRGGLRRRLGAGSACPLLPPSGPSSGRRAGPGVLGSRPTSAPRPPRGALRAGAGAAAVCAGRPGARPRGQASPILRPIQRPRPLPSPFPPGASLALWSPLLGARPSLPGQQDGPPRRGCQARNSPPWAREPRASPTRPLPLKPC